MTVTSKYRGRFAPSPSGLLHFGSIVAAVGSYLEARTQSGAWFVRIDDLDQPRVEPKAAGAILRTLEAFCMCWDGSVLYQSQSIEAYRAALEQLKRKDLVYPCGCTRREIVDSSLGGIDGPIYPGTCRNGVPPGKFARSWRVRTNKEAVAFIDRHYGEIFSHLNTDVGDFVLQRADGLYAYQLAVVVDDAAQGITDVVRGADLLASTPRQIYLQRLLGLPIPGYAHLPIVVNVKGEKLSKQTNAMPVDISAPGDVLWRALDFLGQSPPIELRNDSVNQLWTWALLHWQPNLIPLTPALPSG